MLKTEAKCEAAKKEKGDKVDGDKTERIECMLLIISECSDCTIKVVDVTKKCVEVIWVPHIVSIFS